MGIFKITRTIVKIIAAVVSIAFALNSVYGGLTAMELANGENVQTAPINPGDFVINYSLLKVEIGLDVRNPGLYALTDIVVGLVFEVKQGANGTWTTLLNTTSVELNMTETLQGDIIEPNETQHIGLVAEMDKFELTPQDIADYFGLPPDWDLADLVQLANATIAFYARLTLSFTVAYALGQYKVSVNVVLETDAISQGL
jgi:hypothetical protein